MIVVHLDQLDVIAHALPSLDANTPTPLAVREEVDLFAQVVMPSLFSYVNDGPLNIIVGLLGLVVERTTVPAIVRTKVGLSILTMLISRAELLRQASTAVDAGEWDQWMSLYNRLFDATEPSLPHIFPGTVVDADDVHVWQFLAAMGVAASPEQQQRLVIGVKERVMETVGVSRTLPRELGEQRLGHVNLFMRAIGLDVELLG
jgi:DNA topoisomerase 2-associated protein PAT1